MQGWFAYGPLAAGPHGVGVAPDAADAAAVHTITGASSHRRAEHRSQQPHEAKPSRPGQGHDSAPHRLAPAEDRQHAPIRIESGDTLHRTRVTSGRTEADVAQPNHHHDRSTAASLRSSTPLTGEQGPMAMEPCSRAEAPSPAVLALHARLSESLSPTMALAPLATAGSEKGAAAISIDADQTFHVSAAFRAFDAPANEQPAAIAAQPGGPWGVIPASASIAANAKQAATPLSADKPSTANALGDTAQETPAAPLRATAYWDAEGGLHLWIGADGAALDTIGPVLRRVESFLRSQNVRLVGVMCNGRPWPGHERHPSFEETP